MSIEIKNRWTGAVIKTVEGDTLRCANLSYANLSYANLSYADLSCANLSYANLSYANLSYANLSYADLSYADLRCADLSCANLSYANLSYANLSYADLSYANLRCADLSCANLSYANLSYADLSYANLSCANLRCANLSYAKRYIDGDEVITLRGPRPILTLGPLGSRNDTMMALLTSAGLRIECGCFCGMLDEFKAAVEKNHADNPRHHDEYLAAVRMIKAWAKVETKYADQWEKENPIPAEDGGAK